MKRGFYEPLESFEGLSKGDELTVRPDLCAGNDFGYYTNYSMEKLAGQTVRIKEVLDSDTIRIVETRYFWSPAMFLKPDALQYEGFEIDLDDLLS